MQALLNKKDLYTLSSFLINALQNKQLSILAAYRQ